ncbi:hypothetical protein AGMMS4952_09610 [Spirochaetia bacterium]|nr:hypothetical protein AGMMS4952_09610 [Spirochaetia bacterium]
MNYIDGDTITLDVALSNIRDEKGKTYLRSLMKEKYLSGESVIPARDSGIFIEYVKAINKCGLDKTRVLFYPRIVSKFIDPDKLHEAHIKAIPKIIGWNRDFMDDAVKAYYNENEQFRNAYDGHLAKSEIEQCKIPDKKEFEDFLYSSFLTVLDKDKPDIITVQTAFPMLYKDERRACGRFVEYIIQEFPEIELVEKIAAKAACFPVQDFFPVESFQNYQRSDMGCFEYTVFKRYLELVKPSSRDDVLRLAHYWYQFIHNQENSIPSENMAADFPILDPLIAPYFDEEMLHDLLRISLDSGKEEAYLYDYQWFAHFISIFLLSSKKSVIKRAATEKAIEKILSGKLRALPENVLNQITDFLKDRKYLYDDENAKLLYILHVQCCKEQEDALAFCEEIHKSNSVDKRICYQLYCLTLEKKQPFYLEDHLFDIPFDLFVYPLVDDSAFFPVVVRSLYEKTGTTYKDRRKMVGEIDRFCTAIIDRKDDADMRNRKEKLTLLSVEIKASFLEMCLQRAEQDTSGNHIELFTLLQIEYKFPEEWAALPEDKKDWLYKTCSTFLNTFFSKMQIDQWEPVFDFVIAAVWYVSQKSLWHGLNPLMRVFRNSKTPLVNPDLSPKHALVHEIMHFFKRRDQDVLKQLRLDMAHDFIKYLNPDAIEKRNPEDYTPVERNETGFDETYNEPSPLFRYAYVRALTDLEVKGERGHFYKNILEEYQKNDPSPDVQGQLKQTIKRLDYLRDSISPGRHTQRLYEAFWWIRQAHLLSLGQPVNAEGSRIVRIREWRERDM